jgi:hypothetical protein
VDDPYDSLRIVSMDSCLEQQWRQRRRRRGNACVPDLLPARITTLTGRRGQACPASCIAALPNRTDVSEGPVISGDKPFERRDPRSP